MKSFVSVLGLATLLTFCKEAPTVPSVQAAVKRAPVGQTAVSSVHSDVIQACVNAASGEIKVVSSITECHQNETPLRWNIEGPAGPAGPNGPSGPSGPVGPAGPSDVQAYFSQASGAAARVFCPTGTKVVGGGALATSPSLALTQNFPIDAGGANANGSNTAGWQGATVNFAGTVQVFVLCASP